MTELKKPVTGTVLGEVVKVDDVPEALRIQLNGDARVVTVQDLDGANHPIWFSENQIDEFNLESILFVGNVVSVDVEYRVANETQYEDADGSVQLHEATLIGAINASHASKIALLRTGLPMDFCNAIEASRSAIAEKQAPRNRTVNFGKSGIDMTDKKAVKSLIKQLEEKRERAPQAYKGQYDARINELEAASN